MSEFDVDRAADRFAAAMEGAPSVVIEITPPMLIVVISQIQLALRHPGNQGVSADLAMRFVRQVLPLLPVDVQQLMERGFDPSFDLPTPKVRSCRFCGCTDSRACLDNGVPCHWVSEDVCSACSHQVENCQS